MPWPCGEVEEARVNEGGRPQCSGQREMNKRRSRGWEWGQR